LLCDVVEEVEFGIGVCDGLPGLLKALFGDSMFGDSMIGDVVGVRLVGGS